MGRQPVMIMLPTEQFEALVEQALAGLPPYFQEKMSNVAVLVQVWPTRSDLVRAGVPAGHTLLGLYTGIPLTVRNQGYNLVAPDTITLFQGPIEAAALAMVLPGDEAGDGLARIERQVRRTVLHELAHHFGISDERLRELGAY
ncbi:MAG: metallopeptidase family protein [Ardenticatenaceae bacterium]|nr:metallopeptidase family protein [Ardenticatenaceae bacterium]